MEEDEQEQRRRKVEAGRAKVNGSASSPRCPGVGSTGRAPVLATAPCQERTRPGGDRYRRTLALSADWAGSRPLAAAILNPPPSAWARPRRNHSQSAAGGARRFAERSGAGYAGTGGAALAPGRGGAVGGGRPGPSPPTGTPTPLPQPRPPAGNCQRSRRGGFIERQWCPPDAASLTAARSRSPRCGDGRCHHTCALVHTYWHLRVSLSSPGFLEGLEAGTPCSWATRALPLGLSSASIRFKRRAEIVLHGILQFFLL